jgi:Tol biopolymer transport system component
MPLASGTRLGPYEIQAPIGAGGMGEVYRARDTRLDRTVAIKILPAQFAGDVVFRERFDREARLISSLSHPHICALFDIGQQDDISFLVIEHLEGETLASRLEKGRLKIDQALQVAVQIAGALDTAHRTGVVHRDVKPGNVMLTKTGAKLLDFGLARTGPILSSSSSMSIMPTTPAAVTAEGTILGTLQYMSPEQLDGSEADARSDIFAFGAVVYEMVTGRKAFEGKSQASLIAAIMSADPPPLAALQPIAPAALDRVVRKCLAKDPDERWQSAKDLADELNWIGRAGSTAEAERLPRLPAPVTAPRGRERIAWIAATLAGVATIAVLVLAFAGYLAPRSDRANLYRTSLNLPEGATMEGVAAGRRVALSPDGRYLAFIASRASIERTLWVRNLESLETRPLAGTEGATNPFWSPDSRFIGFIAQGRLRKIEAAGGPPVTVAPEATGLGGTWNRDDVILFVSRAGPLFRVHASGGAVETVTSVDKDSHSDPVFLSDGRHYLYQVTDLSNRGTGGIYVGDLNKQEPPKRLLSVNSNAIVADGYLVFARERALMAQRFDERRLELSGVATALGNDLEMGSLPVSGSFSASGAGTLAYRTGASNVTTSLVWFDRRGTQLSVVGGVTDQMTVALSPEGSRVVVSNLDADRNTRDLTIIDLTRNNLRTRFTFDAADDMAPVWSGDGREVFFSSRRSGRLALFRKPASGVGAEAELLADDLNNLYPGSVSRDGKFLLYFNGNALSRTGNDIWFLPLTGAGTPRPFMQTEFNEMYGFFSPDGRWVAYVSSESGHPEIYVAPFSGAGGKWQVSQGGGSYPRWRQDSSELYFLTADRKLMAATVDGRGPAFVVGEVKTLFQTRVRDVGFAGANAINYDVTPDGQRFLIASTEGSAVESPITFLVNWTAALKP